MHTSEIGSYGYPILLYHGTRDATNSIKNVKDDCESFGNMKLEEAINDTHHLEKLNKNGDILLELIDKSTKWKQECVRNPNLMKGNEQLKKKKQNRMNMFEAIRKNKS